MRAWRRLHAVAWYIRVPIKLAAFLVVLAVVLYPDPRLLVSWIQRIRDMNSVVDPTHPGLDPFVADVKRRVGVDPPPDELLKAVQDVVHERIPYAWDWETWGVMDFLPTVDEALRMGREDCDGRAVVAASVLRRMDYRAELVSDILHVWVETPEGRTMNPTSTERTLVGESGSTRLTITPGLLRNLLRGFAYGVGAFPLVREIVILVAIFVLSLHPRLSFWRAVCGGLLFWIALMTVRSVGIRAAMQTETADVLQVVAGIALAFVGWTVLVARGEGRRERFAEAHPQ